MQASSRKAQALLIAHFGYEAEVYPAGLLSSVPKACLFDCAHPLASARGCGGTVLFETDLAAGICSKEAILRRIERHDIGVFVFRMRRVEGVGTVEAGGVFLACEAGSIEEREFLRTMVLAMALEAARPGVRVTEELRACGFPV